MCLCRPVSNQLGSILTRAMRLALEVAIEFWLALLTCRNHALLLNQRRSISLADEVRMQAELVRTSIQVVPKSLAYPLMILALCSIVKKSNTLVSIQMVYGLIFPHSSILLDSCWCYILHICIVTGRWLLLPLFSMAYHVADYLTSNSTESCSEII